MPKFRVIAFLSLLVAAAGTGWSALAVTEQVAFPFDYARRFFLYNWIEHPEQRPPVLRNLYVNKETQSDAKPGEAVPYNTLLVMEERLAMANPETGAPVRDAYGRMRPTEVVKNVFVMAKRPGLGSDRPAGRRNGEWEYAWFSADGTRVKDQSMDSCFACHQNRANRDFNFSFSKWVLDTKKK